MVTRSQAQPLCDISVTNVRQTTNVPRNAFVAEGAAAALLVVGVVASTTLGFPIGLPLVSACVLAASLLTGVCTAAHGNPLVAILSVDRPFRPDDAAGIALAQIAGAAIAGVLIGVALPAGLLSSSPLVEGTLAAAFTIATVATSRTMPTLVAMTGALVFGRSCLGNPAVAIGLAVATLVRGSIASAGSVLAAQVVGGIVGALIISAFETTMPTDMKTGV